jgi:adenylate kinase
LTETNGGTAASSASQGATPTTRRELHGSPSEEGRVTRLVIMGPQGAGKGTQAARLAETFDIPAISTGDIFRANISGGTELGKLAQEYSAKGELVPDEVTDEMVRSRLGQDDVKGGFLLDGYPRNAHQVEALDAILADLGWELDGVVELTADRDELLARIAKRAEIEGREDDTPEAIARRLDIYDEQTAPLTKAYAERGVLARVDGIGEIAEVTDRIVAALAAELG